MIKISGDTQGHDNDQLLSYIAERIVKTGVPLFGKELPSRNSHELDKASFGEFTVKGDDIHCTSLIPGLFTDVHVRSEDLPKIQDAIKAWRDSRGN